MDRKGNRSSEASRIAVLERLLASPLGAVGGRLPAISLGIGDDAAVLEAPDAGERLVVSVDEQVEGTHFRRELLSLEDIGYRATMAAASDLAAMGARPWAAVAALALPAELTDEMLEALATGQAAAARALAMPIVGGNLARASSLSVSTTVLGLTARPLTRAGARPGDGVYVAGMLGLASLGFRSLTDPQRRAGVASAAPHAGDEAPLDASLFPAPLVRAIDAWRRPLARIEDGIRAASSHGVHAAIDVSDGLAKDLGAICASSRVGAWLEASLLREFAAEGHVDEAARALELELDVLDAMLFGGEDYALVIASAVPLRGFRRIGTFTAERVGVVLVDEQGAEREVRGGFDHFADVGTASAGAARATQS